MKFKKLFQVLHLFILIGLMLLAHGCGYHNRVPPRLAKMEGHTNTFRMSPRQRNADFLPKDRICAIRVYDGNDMFRSNRPFYWEVRATEPVPVNGFRLVAGVVPDGFMQVVPPPGQTFIPVTGKSYYIAVNLDEPQRIPWIPTFWIAD
jgi:hypothetical protein